MADEAVAQAAIQAPASSQYTGNDDVDPSALSRYSLIRRGGGRFTNKKYIRRRGRSRRGRSRRGRSHKK